MIIIPIAFDSFSTRSMFTIIKTDINIFIDPSVAIGPNRYNLSPHPIELKELENRRKEIIDLSESADLMIITHYHWDHCPNPEEEHFNILYNKKIILKDIKDKINNSQKDRGKIVINKLKGKSEIIFGDNKKYNINNTYIEISPPLFHGPENSILGYIIAPYIEYKDQSLFFGSDIQGILNEKTLSYIIEKDPDYIILSGPAFYHPNWDNKLTDIFYSNIKKVLENTKVKEIIIDHHLARSKNYLDIMKKLNEDGKNYGVKFLSAADYINKDNRLLEANRDILYKRSSAAGGT